MRRGRFRRGSVGPAAVAPCHHFPSSLSLPGSLLLHPSSLPLPAPNLFPPLASRSAPPALAPHVHARPPSS